MLYPAMPKVHGIKKICSVLRRTLSRPYRSDLCSYVYWNVYTNRLWCCITWLGPYNDHELRHGNVMIAATVSPPLHAGA